MHNKALLEVEHEKKMCGMLLSALLYLYKFVIALIFFLFWGVGDNRLVWSLTVSIL